MQKNAAIVFEPEAYVLDGPKLMGRQAAGNGYLRAAVQGRLGEPLRAYTPNRQSADVFAGLVRSIDPAAGAEWIPAGRVDALSRQGAVYVPGPVMREAALLRQRAGAAAYSITGVTHTTASHAAMDAIASIPTLPLMPWDALICTSKSVLGTVKSVLEAEQEYLSWRLGTAVRPLLPQLPVIPLGVHTGDFAVSEPDRHAARKELGIGEHEVVALFVGRLSFHAKAHPHQMYCGLEQAHRRTGKAVVLIQCGWHANAMIEGAFKNGARRYAPGVRSLFADGRNPAERRRAWAAADFFISLSDNLQETFGLTIIEAMSAGLPVVASDWDGYRETVRDGQDGYLIPTTMPAAGTGGHFAAAHESGEINYDQYCGVTCRTVSVDPEVLAARISALVSDASLRRALGASAQARALSEFEWQVVYRRYQQLWAELGAVRSEHMREPAAAAKLAKLPKAASSRLDPMVAFAHYPTRPIGPDTPFEPAPGASIADYRALAEDPLYSYVPEALPGEELAGLILGSARGSTPRTIAPSGAMGNVIVSLAILAKMGLVRIMSAAA